MPVDTSSCTGESVFVDVMNSFVFSPKILVTVIMAFSVVADEIRIVNAPWLGSGYAEKDDGGAAITSGTSETVLHFITVIL